MSFPKSKASIWSPISDYLQITDRKLYLLFFDAWRIGVAKS